MDFSRSKQVRVGFGIAKRKGAVGNRLYAGAGSRCRVVTEPDYCIGEGSGDEICSNPTPASSGRF